MVGAFFPSCVHCRWVSVSSSKPGNFLQDTFAEHTVVGINWKPGARHYSFGCYVSQVTLICYHRDHHVQSAAHCFRFWLVRIKDRVYIKFLTVLSGQWQIRILTDGFLRFLLLISVEKWKSSMPRKNLNGMNLCKKIVQVLDFRWPFDIKSSIFTRRACSRNH